MINNPAIPCSPTLDGIDLTTVDARAVTVRTNEVRSLVKLHDGGNRSMLLYAGAGRELIPAKLEIALDYQSIGSMRPTVEELMSVPGPHTIILWRQEYHSWAGNGSRTEFTMPRSLATDSSPTPPNGLPATKFYPEIKVGRSGAILTYVSKSSTDYAAGSPSSGEVWFLAGGTTFKLASAPASGDIVYGRVVPLISCDSKAQIERQFTSPTLEPRKLELVEL